MAQVKVFGINHVLKPIQTSVSEAIHNCAMEALNLPKDKRFHRFFPMQKEDFIFPSDRTEKYLIIEISMFEGRSIEVKKQLIKLIIERLHILGIDKDDIEITIFETPRSHWGIRGIPGDELQLPYKVEG